MSEFRDFMVALFADHEKGFCAAHSEGQACCLDSTDPYGAAIRARLGIDHPNEYRSSIGGTWYTDPVIEWTPPD